MKELLEQGIIGDLKLIRTSQNSFARRYDWQTLLYREGGAMRNNLAHSIEQIMDLASNDELPKIHSKLAIWNSVGDAEDYVHISIEYANGLLCELECTPPTRITTVPYFICTVHAAQRKYSPPVSLSNIIWTVRVPSRCWIISLCTAATASLLIAHTALSGMKKRLHSTPIYGTLSVKSPTVFITLCMTTYSTAENCS